MVNDDEEDDGEDDSSVPCGTVLTADHASLWQAAVMTALPSTFEVERRSVTGGRCHCDLFSVWTPEP